MGSPSKAVARFGITGAERGAALCLPFDYGRNFGGQKTVVIEESVIEEAEIDDVEILFLYERESGDVYEFDLNTVRQNPLTDVEHGDDLYSVELHQARYRWPDLGFDFYNGSTFWNP